MIAGAAALGLAATAAARGAHRAPVPAESPRAAPRLEERPVDHAAEGPFHGLLGVSDADARTRLGPPDLARAEGAGAMWTYRLPDCALFVFLRADPGQPLRVSGAASGPRRRGQSPPPVNQCLAEALDRQTGAGRGKG